MEQRLTVNLGERSYPICFAGNILPELRLHFVQLRDSSRKSVVLTDTNVARTRAADIQSIFGEAPVCVVEAGENSKSLSELGRVLDFLAAQNIDRNGALFAVGGGVIGDLGGFAAAAWLRGIDYYQVPTTLLAMVDSSVGGKTGINLAAGKNLVGAFHQPRGVFIGTHFLSTLPAREFAAGTAEIIKYGLLGDADLFAQLERAPLSLASADLASVITRCCALKAKFVEADERERVPGDGRALLNLGHTFGHAIEQVTGYGSYLHGEAVAIGLCAAARLSAQLGLLAPNDVARVDAVVKAHTLPARLRERLPLNKLIAAMGRDKKVRAGAPRFVVMRKIGDAVTRDDVPLALAEACFREIGAG